MINEYINMFVEAIEGLSKAIANALTSLTFWIIVAVIFAILLIIWLISGMPFGEFFSWQHATDGFFGIFNDTPIGQPSVPDAGAEPPAGEPAPAE